MRKKLSHLFIILIFFSGCQNAEKYRKERIAKADRAFTEIRADQLPKDNMLTLPFCIHTALTRNLNLRVYELKEAVNMEQRTAAALGMLPDVIATNDISVRSNEPGASSYSLLTGTQSLQPSQSSENWENRVRVEFLFSFIDFGLAYFNAVQGKDRALITTEQKRRAAQNLILDVARAYFKVAAAQYAMENTEKMLKISDTTEKLLESMVKNKRVPLEKVIQEKKTFLVLKKSLMEYRRSYENSCIELKSLMGYYPRHELIVDTSSMNELAELKFPEIELMEEIALIERPELFQLDIQKHITAIAARKVIIEMFPNVGIFVDFTNSTNKYLYYNSWWELGARAAYRLLRVPQKMIEYSAIETEVDQIEMQVRALSVGIISQVRIAYANLKEVEQRYLLSEKLYDAYLKHEQIKEAQATTSGSLSQIELNRIKMETAQKDIERTQALGNYYLAYFRLLNSVGLNSLDPETLNEVKDRVKESFEETEYEEAENIAEYKMELADVDKEIAQYNQTISELNSNISLLQGKVNDLKTSKEFTKGKLASRESQLLHESESRVDELSRKIADASYSLERSRKDLVNAKYDYERQLAQAENTFNKSMDSYNARDVEDDSLLDNIRDTYSKAKSDIEDKYERDQERLKDKISASEDEIEKLQDDIQEQKEKTEKDLSNLRESYLDQIEDHNDSSAEHSENLAEYNAELKTNMDKLSKLQIERAEIQKKLDASQSVIDEHSDKLGRYMRAKVIGNICMDQCMVDITHIDGVKVNDEAIVIGKQGKENITMEEFASKLGTINYEAACMLSARIPRIYIKT